MKTEIRTRDNPKFITRGKDQAANGFLVPLFNIHDGFFERGKEPRQVYLTAVSPGAIKGPHLHHIRTGCFTCIKGNVRVVLKVDGEYQVFLTGDAHNYRSVIVPTGTPAAIQNLGTEDALVLNMPCPAWTPQMNDEHTADFSDFDFSNP